MRVLLVEDERRLAEAIAQVLKKHHYSIDLAYDGEYGLDCALSGIYDLIILDILLPKLDGLSVLRKIREMKMKKTHVILLTAKGETEDKVLGLDSGADDYLTKPFQTEELLARLRALGRRNGEWALDNILRFEDMEYNPHTLDLWCDDKSFRLTLKEGQMLELLIRHGKMIVSSRTMIEKLWGFDTETEDSHVQVYISFLRKKLAQLNSSVRIKTLRGAGYTLAVTEDEVSHV